jgi:outer membrane immunogenic protein
VAAPVFTWTGFYVGLNAGAAFNGGGGGAYTPNGFPVAATPAGGNILVGTTGNNVAFAGGGQIGYNYQFGAFVAGLEADIQGIGRSGSGYGATAPVGGLAGVAPYALATGAYFSPGYLGAVRGRLGYAVDRALFYVTGGFAYSGGYGNRSVAYYSAANATAVPTAVYTGASGSTTGYTVGGGVEYAVSNNWTVKGEYLYANVGGGGNLLTSAALPGTSFSNKTNQGVSLARVGVNYKF